MVTVKSDIDQIIADNLRLSRAEALKVTPDVVKEAVKRMKPDKTDVTGAYTSDVFINAPDSLFVHLAAVFRSYIVHGTITKETLACAFMPLFKGGLKDPSKFDSYRAIAGASQILKLFEYVVLELWGDCLQTDSLQFGFKKSVHGWSWRLLIITTKEVARSMHAF